MSAPAPLRTWAPFLAGAAQAAWEEAVPDDGDEALATDDDIDAYQSAYKIYILKHLEPADFGALRDWEIDADELEGYLSPAQLTLLVADMELDQAMAAAPHNEDIEPLVGLLLDTYNDATLAFHLGRLGSELTREVRHHLHDKLFNPDGTPRNLPYSGAEQRLWDRMELRRTRANMDQSGVQRFLEERLPEDAANLAGQFATATITPTRALPVRPMGSARVQSLHAAAAALPPTQRVAELKRLLAEAERELAPAAKRPRK